MHKGWYENERISQERCIGFSEGREPREMRVRSVEQDNGMLYDKGVDGAPHTSKSSKMQRGLVEKLEEKALRLQWCKLRVRSSTSSLLCSNLHHYVQSDLECMTSTIEFGL